jgi:ferredoxin-NADP reductase
MTQALEPDFSSLLVQDKTQVAKDIWYFKLVHPQGHALPDFKAGAHITVQTPAGQRRNYSLWQRSRRNQLLRDRHQVGTQWPRRLSKHDRSSACGRFAERQPAQK